MSLTDGKPLNESQPAQPGVVRSKSSFRYDLVAFLLIFGILAYIVYDMHESKKPLKEAQDQIVALKKDLAAAANKNEKAMEIMREDFSVVRGKLGVTQAQLDQARESAQRLKTEQEKTVNQLNAKLSQKADAQQLSAFKEEASTKLGAVNADVTAVKSDVDATKKEIEKTNRDLVDVKETLSAQIAKNRDELQTLRLKGDRNFYEFDVQKKKGPALVGDLRIGIINTNPKKKKFDIRIIVDDNTLEKKDRTVNEPIQFLVGRTKLRYEIVINDVQKDRIIGYLSTPKDKGLSAER